MKTIFDSILTVSCLLALAVSALADVKIRQRVTMNGQTYETTKMIKGARERTENKGEAANPLMSQVATITQCDLRRTVLLNDSKKLYFIEPFADETLAGETPVPGQPDRQPQRGGTVTMTVSITDTNERQTLFGLTARHLIVVHETETSANSCSGAGKSKMEIDGWYVDFAADFSCPVNVQMSPRAYDQPDCKDRIIVKQTGKGTTGFLLSGTTRFYDGNGDVLMTQTIETLELSSQPLAAGLFDIPKDYTPAASAQELYSMPDMTDLMNRQDNEETGVDEQPDAAPKTFGINVTSVGDAKIDRSEISRYLAVKLRENEFKTRAGATDGVDYVLQVEINKVKESAAGKAGGIFGKVTGVETKAGKTEVELTVTLTKPGTTTPAAQKRVAKKFDGNASTAVRAALDEALEKILAEFGN